MKKHATPYLLLLFVAIAFLSCEQATFTIEQSPELTIEQRFEKLKKPLVLYQFSSVHLESGEESGWIIDHQGHLKTYQRTLSPGALPSVDHEIWSKGEVSLLYTLASESGQQVSLAELYNHFQQSKRLQPGFLSSQRVYQEAARSNAFYAYTSREAGLTMHGDQDWCKSETQDLPPGKEQVNRIVLNLSGYIERHGNSKEALDLYDWLQGLDQQLGR